MNLVPTPRVGWRPYLIGRNSVGVPQGQVSYLAEALQQPHLLPRDMKGLWATRQPDLFMSLKRDMAMVNQDPSLFSFFILHQSICYFLLINFPLLPCRSLKKLL